MYGSKVVAPTELALPTHKIAAFIEVGNTHAMTIDLDLLEERRITARLRSEAYKERTKKNHAPIMNKRPLYIGDWV